MRTALVAGATGLIGSNLLKKLLDDEGYTAVKAVTRKPLEFQHAKLQNLVIDFNLLETVKDQLAADDIFCCLGTTMKKARSKEEFRKVDYDYPVRLATAMKSLAAQQFLLVSALGADRNSAFYYNQVKGEVEGQIARVGFERYHIFRPSLLLGDRKEQRSGEEAAKTFYKLFNFLIPKRLKGIEGAKVATAMIHFAKIQTPGVFVHDSASLQSFST